MKLTWTKISFMHGQCDDDLCPICGRNSSIADIDLWLRKYLTIEKTGSPKSPWWEVREQNGDCYRALRGNLRHPGYYDQNPDAQ